MSRYFDDDDEGADDEPPRNHAMRKFGVDGAISKTLPSLDQISPDERIFLESMTANPPLPLYLAGAAAGWSPAEVDARMKDKGFAAIVRGCEDLVLDAVEQTVVRRAVNGNLTAAKMVLAAKRPDVWADKREVRIDGRMVVSTEEKQAIMAGMVDVMRSSSPEERRQMISTSRQRAIEATATDTDDA